MTVETSSSLRARAGDDMQEPDYPPVGRTVLRLPRALFDRMHADLARPHPFAFERIGFVTVRGSHAANGVEVLIAAEYFSILDDEYVESRGAGARIGGDAIRRMLTEALSRKCGVLHVHAHRHSGVPAFSATDRREQPRLIESLRAIEPTSSHGMLVLSDDEANAWIWEPGSPSHAVPTRISIVGYPLTILSGSQLANDVADTFTVAGAPRSSNVADDDAAAEPAQVCEGERHSRQTFLGSDSTRQLATVRVGLIGYGGGGSHIGQQLAHLGIKHVRIADGDVVEESNLNRLVGATERDVELATTKVDVAVRVLKAVDHSMELVTHAGRWQEAVELFRDCDVLIGCVDTFAERRDLEIFSRRHAIAYIDIGMDVHELEDAAPRMAGQVILSMPDEPCMWCLGFLTADRVAREAAQYGAAGSRPQVVWPNGILASSAIAVLVDLVTGWTRRTNVRVYLSYDGNLGTLTPHSRLPFVGKTSCSHFSSSGVGTPVFLPLAITS